MSKNEAGGELDTKKIAFTTLQLGVSCWFCILLGLSK